MKVLCATFFYLHVTREKLPKRLSYEKGSRKMLKRLTPAALSFSMPSINSIKFETPDLRNYHEVGKVGRNLEMSELKITRESGLLGCSGSTFTPS
jgi:hypothetical protein